MATPLHATLPKALVGQYDVERELGRGGMATVYLARDRRHERYVAIKVLLPELTATAGTDRFRREIKLVARLQHPHILPLFDSGEAAGMMFFVMPFVDGESLRARLDRDAAIPLQETMRIVRQLADALDYAHARGVVHRDVKPENVLLTGGQAVLADFGIAHAPAAASPDGGTLTSAGMTLGTPRYMSPEQASAESDIDGRSDLYSLGCVCYEMLSGSAPFTGSNAIAIMSGHIATPPPPLEGLRETLPQSVKAAVGKSLEKNPADRFGTVGEFAGALEGGVIGAMADSPADIRLRAIERQQETRERVLVLEFANIAGAADADWLSTGIAETVSADLNKIAGVKVVGQDATTRQRIDTACHGRLARTDQALDLGRSVGARWVVWGGFQKFGPRIRITTHIAETGAGTEVREEKLDGVMDDIFLLQDRIVTTVSSVLGIRLTTAEVTQIRQPETANLSAYEHLARGYQAWHRFGKASVNIAAEHFRAAIAIDPNYALAHAGLGIIHGPLYIATGQQAVLDEGVAVLERARARPFTWRGVRVAFIHAVPAEPSGRRHPYRAPRHRTRAGQLHELVHAGVCPPCQSRGHAPARGVGSRGSSVPSIYCHQSGLSPGAYGTRVHLYVPRRLQPCEGIDRPRRGGGAGRHGASVHRIDGSAGAIAHRIG